MNSAQASSAIKLSALTVAGVYFYRRFTESPSAAAIGRPEMVAPLGQFLVAWSVIYLTLSLGAGPAPALAGWMAVLVAVAVMLGNGAQVAKDLQRSIKPAAAEGRGHRRRKGGKGASSTGAGAAARPGSPDLPEAVPNPNEARIA